MRLYIGLQRQRGHHRHEVKKQQGIPTEQIRDFVALYNFDKGPDELITQPASEPGGHEGQNRRVRPRCRKTLGRQEKTADSNSRHWTTSLIATSKKLRPDSNDAAIWSDTRHTSPTPHVLTREDIDLAPSNSRMFADPQGYYVSNQFGKTKITLPVFRSEAGLLGFSKVSA